MSVHEKKNAHIYIYIYILKKKWFEWKKLIVDEFMHEIQDIILRWDM